MQTSKRDTCSTCLRPISVCFCSCLNHIKISQSILIIRDKSERLHPFNTAIMAKLQIENLEIIDTDNDDFENVISKFIIEQKPYLLFKNHESKLLTSTFLNEQESTNFIAIDGTWDKAKAIYLKYEILQSLNLLHIEPSLEQETIYKDIRKATIKDSLSTLEAIKLALEITHNKTFHELLAPLEYTIKAQKKFSKNTL